jgi:hypothetical protein
MLDNIVDFAIKLVVPTILAFGFILVKKGCQIISKRLNVEISEKEWEIIDRMVEESVRAVEEDSRTSALSSDDKEELALAKIKQFSFRRHWETPVFPLPTRKEPTFLVTPSNERINNGELGNSCDESILRTKVKACVNKLYNQNKQGKNE